MSTVQRSEATIWLLKTKNGIRHYSFDISFLKYLLSEYRRLNNDDGFIYTTRGGD